MLQTNGISWDLSGEVESLVLDAEHYNPGLERRCTLPKCDQPHRYSKVATDESFWCPFAA